MRPGECTTARDVDALVERLYGREDLAAREGVLHVTALWDPPGHRGPLVTLRINEHTPRSEHDAFVLNLARARADAIVCTGKMLRMEPHTRYDLQGPGELPAALGQWRRRRAGRGDPPLLVVLTSGRGFDPDHVALHGAPVPVVFTSDEGAERVRRGTRGTRIEMVAARSPSIRAAVEWVRRERGARLVSIEAGPTASSELYADPTAVDELMLSRYREPELDERVQGPALLSWREIETRVGRGTPPFDVDEPSGRWSFSLHRRP